MRAYWTAGATMALEDAIRYALDERMLPPPSASAETTTEAVSDEVGRIEQSPDRGDAIHRDARETGVLPDPDLIR
jgi:hypothetical protein